MTERKKLDVMKVDPMFKNAFKLEATKQGFPTLAEFTRSLTRDMAKQDTDIAELICNKKKREDNKSNNESYFSI